MGARKLWPRLATGLLLLGPACGPSAAIDRVLLSSIEAGGAAGGADSGAGGAEGGSSGQGGGGVSGTGGSTPGTGGSTPGTGGSAPGTGGSAPGTGGSAPGTGGATSTSDGGAADTINLEAVLEVTHAPGAASTNLTSEGKLDWVHWALGTDPNAVNRKRSVTPLITTRKLGAATQGHYDNRPTAVSWTDGSPTLRATDSTDGLVVADVLNAGFELKAPGLSTRPRTLKVLLGGWQVAGKLTASIGGRTYTDATFRNSSDPGSDRVYTIVFQPVTDGEPLTVRWTVTEVLQMYGNITVQAATLSE
jgi:hypothetical protein